MSNHLFSDLHCHPAMHPLMLEKDTIWDTHLGSNHRKIKQHQKKGKRGGLYDQAGYPKLINSKVKLVYASLYSLEQGFMMNNSLLLSGINTALKVGLIWPLLLQVAGINVHVRDFIMSLYTKYKVKRLRVLKEREYWDEFLSELEVYKRLSGTQGDLTPDTIGEINSMLDYAYGSNAQPINKKGSFTIADGNWDLQLPQDDQVLTVLTMEGMAIVSQTKQGARKSKHGTKLVSPSTIAKRFKFIKEQTPVFFVTFSHHFSSELCGHARSLPNMARDLGFLNQEYYIDKGFSKIGYMSLLYLLAVKQENGKLIRDKNAGRRIFIDIKHLSLRGRMTLYQVVRTYNAAHPDDKIPIIASHTGFSDRSIGKMLQTINSKQEKDRTQQGEKDINGRKHIYNTWSINIGIEEVKFIVESGGLIGVSLEQNNLGVKFGKKTKREPYDFFAGLVMNQMLSMAKAADTKDFWDCVTMGTDFDGLIDPVDKYSSTLFFERLRTDLRTQLSGLTDQEKRDSHFDHFDIDDLLDKIFFNNAFGFLQRNFDKDRMPKLND